MNMARVNAFNLFESYEVNREFEAKGTFETDELSQKFSDLKAVP